MFLLFLRGFLHVRVVVHQSLSVQLDVRQGFHLLILRGGHLSQNSERLKVAARQSDGKS